MDSSLRGEGETGDRPDPIPVFVLVTGQIPGLITSCLNSANRRDSIKAK